MNKKQKNMKKIILILIFFISLYSHGEAGSRILSNPAQKVFLFNMTDSIQVAEKHRKIKSGVDYASVSAFKGRKDTTGVSLLSPYFEYTGKHGFYTRMALDHVPGGKRKFFDEFNSEIGWNFDFSDNWDGFIGYSHYFYDSQVARIMASVSNEIKTNVGYDWKYLYSFLDFDWSGGNNKFPYKGVIVTTKSHDFQLAFSNSHQFSFDRILKRSANLSITPDADILYGTQNFLVTYKGKTNTSEKVYQQQAKKFRLTGYVFYLEIKYKIKKLTMELSPNYTIPKNVPKGESTKPFFVMDASVYVTFK